MYRFFVITFVACCVFLYVKSEEAMLQINTKKYAYTVSDKFISFSVDPQMIFDNKPISSETLKMARSLHPAYLRISGPSTNRCHYLANQKSQSDGAMQHHDDHFGFDGFMWKLLLDWIKLANLTPVIALNYDANKWDPKEVIRLLGLTKDLGVKECVWQLGNEINPNDIQKYSEDVYTLRAIVDALSDGNGDWSVAGSDVTSEKATNRIKMFLNKCRPAINAFTWKSKNAIRPSDPMDLLSGFRSLVQTQTKAWLSHSARSVLPVEKRGCGEKCILDGLAWAQSLGEAAKAGFDVIFKELNRREFTDNNLAYYISLLHKSTVGTRVLDTKMSNGEKIASYFYSHCARNNSGYSEGAMTVFGMNMGDEKLKTTMMATTKTQGIEIWQYIITVQDNAVFLNDEPINVMENKLEPLVKLTHPSRPMVFQLHPKSIGFWILPDSKTPACMNDDLVNKNKDSDKNNAPHKTSSVVLLQQLIQESRKHDESQGKIRKTRELEGITNVKYSRKQLLKNTLNANHLKDSKMFRDSATKSNDDYIEFSDEGQNIKPYDENDNINYADMDDEGDTPQRITLVTVPNEHKIVQKYLKEFGKLGAIDFKDKNYNNSGQYIMSDDKVDSDDGNDAHVINELPHAYKKTFEASSNSKEPKYFQTDVNKSSLELDKNKAKESESREESKDTDYNSDNDPCEFNHQFKLAGKLYRQLEQEIRVKREDNEKDRPHNVAAEDVNSKFDSLSLTDYNPVYSEPDENHFNYRVGKVRGITLINSIPKPLMQLEENIRKKIITKFGKFALAEDILDTSSVIPNDTINLLKLRMEKQRKKLEIQKQCKAFAISLEQLCLKEVDDDMDGKRIFKREIEEKYVPIVEVVKLTKNKRKLRKYDHKLLKNKLDIKAKRYKSVGKSDLPLKRDMMYDFPPYNRLKRNIIRAGRDFSWENEISNKIDKSGFDTLEPISPKIKYPLTFIQNIPQNTDKEMDSSTENMNESESDVSDIEFLTPAPTYFATKTHYSDIIKKNSILGGIADKITKVIYVIHDQLSGWWNAFVH